MQKQAPSAGRIGVMVVFALSCFGLLLFLWNAFGGSSPLQSRGYRFKVAFPEATQLSTQADVRISGVPVGKVVTLSQGTDRTVATIQMKSQYAPVHVDAHAILRLKTLLGETFVELTPGSPTSPTVPENGRLADAQVAQTTELDEVLRTFDKPTRTAFKGWFTGWAKALEGRGQDFNDVVGNLGPFAQDGADLTSILDTQRHALATLVRDTGVTFGALGRQEAATRTLITAGNQVFGATAARDDDLQRTLTILPTFLRELTPTLAAVEDTSRTAAPVLRDLKPAAPLLKPVLANTVAIAPDLQTLFRRLDPVITLARTGLPAATATLKAADPVVGVLDPLARELNPIVDYMAKYHLELTQMFANTAAATQAVGPGGTDGRDVHYLRSDIPISNELLVNASHRGPTNRHNPYFAPGAFSKLATGLEAIDCSNTSNSQSGVQVGSGPPCKVQTPPDISGHTFKFPHLDAVPPTRR